MYNKYDYVIHQNNHIYQIILIDDKYTLKSPLTNNSILANPKEIIRKITNKDELEEIIDRIPYLRTLEITSERFRQEIYKRTFNKCSEIEWIKLIKTIYLRKRNHKAQDYELDYLKQTQQLFYEEIAVVLNIAIDKVEDYIKEKIIEF